MTRRFTVRKSDTGHMGMTHEVLGLSKTWICQCASRKEAQKICDALNLADGVEAKPYLSEDTIEVIEKVETYLDEIRDAFRVYNKKAKPEPPC